MAALNPPLPGLQIAAPLWEQMAGHVAGCLPEEACGLLGGTRQEDTLLAAAVLPVENALHSPVRFRMQPHQQLQAMLWLEAQNLELVGIFHSHPNGPDHPSETDVAEASFPDAIHLIWSCQTGAWTCRAFRILGQAVLPAGMVVE